MQMMEIRGFEIQWDSQQSTVNAQQLAMVEQCFQVYSGCATVAFTILEKK